MQNPAWSEERETALVLAAQAGDFSAYDALVRRYRPASVSLANQVLHQRERAEDAAQDALLSVYTALPHLEDARRFPAWLATIVRNRALRLAKGERRTAVPLDSIVLAYTPALNERLDESERRRVVRVAIAELSDEVRPVVELYYLDDWAVREIAGFLGLPETTVKWRLHTGRKHLRASLSSQLEECYERELI